MSKRFLSGINVTGTATLNTVANAGLDTDKFLVLDAAGNIDFRTGDELKLDIGANVVSRIEHEVKLGETMTIGTPVYIGVDLNAGTNMTVYKATNATEAGSSKTIGLIASSGITNDLVEVVTEGLLAGLNTSTATKGDPVWLGVNGALLFGLANKPVAPAHMVFLGIVTRVQQNNGEIFVKVQNGFEMNEIHNYLEGSVQNNEVIVYESATSLYKPKTIPTILGYTPVPDSRTITINGTTYDLSANRAWTITTDASARSILRYVATANQTTFTISGGYTPGLTDVYRNGVKLDNSTDFTATNGTTIVLTNGASVNDVIEVYRYQTAFLANNALRTVTEFIATAGQTTFSVAYNTGLVDVFYNGSKLLSTEYTAGNGTSIILNFPCNVNDTLEVHAYSYAVGAFTGQAQLNGTGFVKANGTTITYDNSTYLVASAISGTTGYIPKFTASGSIGNSSIQENGSLISMASGITAFRFNDSSANIQYNSNLTIGIPAEFTAITFNSSGNTIIGGTLSGTSATFSGSVTSNGTLIAGLANGNIRLKGSADGFLGVGESNGTLYLTDWATGAKGLSIVLATGAATFSSSVTATSEINLLNAGVQTGQLYADASDFYVGGQTGKGLRLCTNNLGNTRMFISVAGNVGIGTSSPVKTLDVYNSANSNTAQIKVGDGGSTARAYLGTFSNNLYLSCGGTYSSGWTTDGTNGIANIVMDAFNGGSTITFGTAASNTSPTERIRITSGGAIGLNGNTDVTNVHDKFSFGYYNSNYGWLQTWSGTPLYLNKVGNAVYAGTQRIDNNSDQRIKENILPIENALNVVLSLNGRKFNMLDENGKLRYGFVAQEVKPHLSDFVTESDRTFEKDDIKIENLLTLESSGASWAAILVEAIKEQQAQIEELKALIAAK